MPQQYSAPILRQEQVAPETYHLSLAWPGVPPRPGQFFTLKAPAPDGTLLRRPLAAAGWHPAEHPEGRGTVDFLYLRRGTATRGYSRMEPGQELSLIGPLGRGFTPPPAGRRPILLGGGIGTGPMLFTAQNQARSQLTPLLILGFRTAGAIPHPSLAPLRKSGSVEIALCTDDGTEGFAGTAADYLSARISPEEPLFLQACGPHPMLQAVRRWCMDRPGQGIPLEVSLEAMMACGVGACAGCAVPAASGTPENPQYKKVCSDGPVFSSEEILWT